MKIIKIDPSSPEPKIIDKAIEVLKNGGVVAYPSDTCYGLGADITNPFALDKLYKIKRREYNKPISIIVKSIKEIEKIAIVDENQKQFLKKYLPGEITVILLNTDFSNFKNNSLGIRMPKYKLLQILAEKFAQPFSSTSANIAGLPACYSAEEVIYQFKNNKHQPDLLLDGGILPKRSPSTVVNLIKWPPKVLRQGNLKISETK